MISYFRMVSIIELVKKFAKEKQLVIIVLMQIYILLILIFGTYSIIYMLVFFLLKGNLKKRENAILSLFSEKVTKIPALVEVMRPYVVDASAFDSIIKLHTEAIINEYTSIYHLLEHNARVQRDILFLFELSMHIPDLQKHEYFLYIRDFIMGHERNMKSLFSGYNASVDSWNSFITLKNVTLLGLVFPGVKLAKI
jgi:hypothetical protein